MSRLLKLTALLGAGYGLWRLLRQTGEASEPIPALDYGGSAPDSGPAVGGSGIAAPAATPSQPTAPSATAPPSPSEPAPSKPSGASKAELYERAKKLDIPGRSKMSKAELERAIRDAG